MSEESLDDQNFQQFLKLLNEIEEKRDGNIDSCNVASNFDHRESSKSDEKETTVSLSKVIMKSPTKIASRRILRKPGFVYRGSNNSSVLDNNAWELSCSKRVFKAPSFKYRKTRSSSPYSLHVLDDLSSLSLESKSNKTHEKSASTPTDIASTPWFKNFSTERSTNSLDSRGSASNVFLPLSKSRECFPQFGEDKKRGNTSKVKIKPAKLKILNTNLPQIKEEDSTKKRGNFGETLEKGLPSYSDLSQKCPEWPKSNKKECFGSKNGEKSFLQAKFCAEHKSMQREKKSMSPFRNSCSYEARRGEQDVSVDDLSLYVEDFLVLPQKMSTMAEMMYT